VTAVGVKEGIESVVGELSFIVAPSCAGNCAPQLEQKRFSIEFSLPQKGQYFFSELTKYFTFSVNCLLAILAVFMLKTF